MNADPIVDRAESIARNSFEAGAREVAMMVAFGQDTIERMIEEARERAIARTPELEAVLRG